MNKKISEVIGVRQEVYPIPFQGPGSITIHKSQGSEYRAVVMPILTQHYVMLQRNLLYTGITRARELVVIVGSKKALGIAVRNDKQQLRYSRLAARLAA